MDKLPLDIQNRIFYNYNSHPIADLLQYEIIYANTGSKSFYEYYFGRLRRKKNEVIKHYRYCAICDSVLRNIDDNDETTMLCAYCTFFNTDSISIEGSEESELDSD